MIKAALSALALFATVGTAAAQTLKIEKYQLANGMTVILHEDHSLPIATINTWFKVGSKDEPDRRSGFAHLYEHLMFMGTNRVPNGDFDRLMEAAGGQNNASTAEDRTNYYSSGPSNILPLLLYLDADRLEDLGRAMTKEKVALQREVVLNERRQTTENTPYGKAYEAISSLMFPKGHPYSWSVIGSPADLNAAQVEDVKAFFATYYVPRNASLVVAGDFDPKEIKPLIAQWYGTLPAGKPVPRRAVPKLVPLGIKRVTIPDRVTAPKTIEVWHSAKAGTVEDLALGVAGRILADGPGTRLYDRLITRDRVASEVSVEQDSQLLGSLLSLDATAPQGGSLDRLERAADEELARFRKEGPTKVELARAVAKTEAGLLNSLQRLERRADMLNSWSYYYGSPDSLGLVLKRLRGLTPTLVRDAFRASSPVDNRLIVRVVPAKAAPRLLISSHQAENPRAKVPVPTPPRPFVPPTPQVFRLSNGIEVRYFPRPELPLMTVTLTSRAGADTDPLEKGGRAFLMGEALSEGAGKLSGTEFRSRLDLLGATFNISVGRQSALGSVSVPARNFGPAVGLFALALREPRFDSAEVDRLRRLTLDAIARRSDNPSLVASLVASRELFGASTLYGRAVDGERATVAALTPEDLRQAHRSVFRPDGVALFAAGSLPQAEVKVALEREFGSWQGPKGIAQFFQPATPPAGTGTRLVIVDRPDAVQTVIAILAPGLPYSASDRMTLEAFSTVLGGSFTSRLNQKLREEKGYTYGAGQSFTFDRDLGFARLGTSVRADVTGASLQEILRELERIRAGDITSEEGEKAAALLRQSIVGGLGTLEGLTATSVGQWLVFAPDDALARDLAQIASLDSPKVNAVASTAFAFDRAVIVLVGDRKKIEAQIAGLPLPKPIIAKL